MVLFLKPCNAQCCRLCKGSPVPQDPVLRSLKQSGRYDVCERGHRRRTVGTTAGETNEARINTEHRQREMTALP